MNSPHSRFRLIFSPPPRLAVLPWLVLPWLVLPQPLAGQDIELNVVLHSGSVLPVQMSPGKLVWRDLLPGRPSEPRTISLSEIERLVLASEARTQWITRIKSLAAQLGHPDYHLREQAEEELKRLHADKLSEILNSELPGATEEVALRIRRILSGRTTKPTHPEEYDWLRLENGEVLRGDAGDFQFSAQFRGQSLKLGRAEVASLTRQNFRAPTAETNLTPQPFHLPRLVPQQASESSLQLVDFDQDFAAQDRENGSRINDQFVFQGLRFAAEIPGYIGIKNIPKESQKFGVIKRGICVFDTQNPESVRVFHGVTRIGFCQPGAVGMTSGIRQIGLAAETIDLPRDIILQAFNGDGHLLATVEANESSIAWFGLQAAEPIARVRVLSNPYLFHLPRAAEVDTSYLIDNLQISDPQPMTPLEVGPHAMTRLRSGELIVGDPPSFQADGRWQLSETFSGEVIQAPLAELDWVAFANSGPPLPEPKSNRWFALLADRSVVEVQPGAEFVPVRLKNWTPDRSQILAVHSSRDYLRFPLEGDFQNGPTLLVFPTCRIACQSLELNADGYNWSAGQPKTLLQPVVMPRTSQGELVDENPAPVFTQLSWSNPLETQYPTLWFREPPPLSPDAGYVNLRNGEKMVFGPQSFFQLAGFHPQGIDLTYEPDQTLQITWDEIWKIQFPPSSR